MIRGDFVRVFCMLLSVAACAPASAQTTVYRCGPEGREYSATPCPGGKAVQAGDSRSADQQREAQHAARRESALADKLAAERRQQDAAPKPGAARLDAPAIVPAKAKHGASKPKKKKSGAPVDRKPWPPVRAASAAR